MRMMNYDKQSYTNSSSTFTLSAFVSVTDIRSHYYLTKPIAKYSISLKPWQTVD